MTDNEKIQANIDFEQWVRHPGTRLFLKWLDEHREIQIKRLCSLSGTYEEFTTDKMQRESMRLATLDLVIAVVKNPVVVN